MPLSWPPPAMLVNGQGDDHDGKARRTDTVWQLLWESLDGGVRNLAALKASAREDSHFAEEMGLDSLELLEFFLRLDEKFGVSLSEDDYSELTSVQIVVAFLERRAAPA
jgi:acyl carrier protein